MSNIDTLLNLQLDLQYVFEPPSNPALSTVLLLLIPTSVIFVFAQTSVQKPWGLFQTLCPAGRLATGPQCQDLFTGTNIGTCDPNLLNTYGVYTDNDWYMPCELSIAKWCANCEFNRSQYGNSNVSSAYSSESDSSRVQSDRYRQSGTGKRTSVCYSYCDPVITLIAVRVVEYQD